MFAVHGASRGPSPVVELLVYDTLKIHSVVVLYTQGEVTSQNLWSQYDHHFVGITRHNASS